MTSVNQNRVLVSNIPPFVPFVLVAAMAVAFVYLDKKMHEWQHGIHEWGLRKKFNVSWQDDFVKDGDLLRRLQNDTLWRACDAITAADHEEDSGGFRFWYYPSNDPVNVFEEVAVLIYKDTEYWEKAVSYEYWCNIMEEKNQEWPWHTDRDEDVLDARNKLIFPLMGSIYYGYNEFYEGGEFHIINSVPYEIGGPGQARRPRHPDDECYPNGMCVPNLHLFSKTENTKNNEVDESLFVETKFNRILYANVTHFHKVSRVRSGKRYSLAVNANHWLPVKGVERAPTNDEMIERARKLRRHQ